MDRPAKQQSDQASWQWLHGLARILPRALVLLGIWYALTGGEAWWSWGTAFALAGAAASYSQMPVRGGRFRALLRLPRALPYLVRETLASGWDVARRALAPRLDLRPDLLDVQLQADAPQLQMAVAFGATLMPGTLAITLAPGCLHLHVIDARLDNQGRMESMEVQLAPLFKGAAP